MNVLRAMLYGRGKDIPEIYGIGLSLLRECKEKAPGVFENFEADNENYRDLADLSFVHKEQQEQALKKDVEILASTPDCEKLVAKAALIESGRFSSPDIESALADKRTVSKILDAVFASDRPRALESAVFTVKFNDISLSTLTHLARHRMQGLCVPQLDSCNREAISFRPRLKRAVFLKSTLPLLKERRRCLRNSKAQAYPPDRAFTACFPEIP